MRPSSPLFLKDIIRSKILLEEDTFFPLFCHWNDSDINSPKEQAVAIAYIT